jgi:hypothetical protein
MWWNTGVWSLAFFLQHINSMIVRYYLSGVKWKSWAVIPIVSVHACLLLLQLENCKLWQRVCWHLCSSSDNLWLVLCPLLFKTVIWSSISQHFFFPSPTIPVWSNFVFQKLIQKGMGLLDFTAFMLHDYNICNHYSAGCFEIMEQANPLCDPLSLLCCKLCVTEGLWDVRSHRQQKHNPTV